LMTMMIMITMMLLPKSGWLPEGGVRAVSPDHHNNRTTHTNMPIYVNGGQFA
jgi:hypothetical protein